MINLVLQSFGRESEYRRALLTILSYYAYTSLPLGETKVILFTDNPEYFRPYLDGLPMSYILLTPDKIKEMRGKIDFLHRMKVALIDEAFGMIEGNMLYADSDTFFIGDPTELVNQVAPTKAFMHIFEYSFESMRQLQLPMAKTFHAFLDLIERQTFLLQDGTHLKVNPQQASWNAGVMIFHPDHARFMQDVFLLTDQFYPPTLNHASEQYAFSVMLQNNVQLAPCDSVIYHYWYRVKKQVVDLFLNEKITAQWGALPMEVKLNNIRSYSELLPNLFESHILSKKDNAIQAFNENDFTTGYKYAWQAIKSAPLDTQFLKDVLYHSKRKFFN